MTSPNSSFPLPTRPSAPVILTRAALEQLARAPHIIAHLQNLDVQVDRAHLEAVHRDNLATLNLRRTLKNTARSLTFIGNHPPIDLNALDLNLNPNMYEHALLTGADTPEQRAAAALNGYVLDHHDQWALYDYEIIRAS